MTPRTLDKRTSDNRLFDIVCSDLLDDDEVIISATIKADAQVDNGLMFGDPMVNPAPMSFPKLGKSAGIGKAVQVRIGGGVIPDGAGDLFCTLRLLMVTTVNSALEATVLLRLTNAA